VNWRDSRENDFPELASDRELRAMVTVDQRQRQEDFSAQSSGHPQRFLILHEFPPPDLERAWRECLTRVEAPAHYESPEYFLEPYWAGNNPFAVLAFSGSKIIGVVTGLHKGGEVVSGLPSRPQICIDPSADETLAIGILADGLLKEAGSSKLITLYSWASRALPAFERRGYRLREVGEVVVLDLSAGAQALFDNLAKNRRRDVRLAIRNGIEVSEETTAEDLQDYWEVYSAWRKTERKQIHHNRNLASIEKVHHMRGNHRRFLARREGKVIAAAGVRFHTGGMIEYANNCSLDEFIKLLPNDLLVWRVIEWACEHGFRRFSLGGAHPFLRKWGGTVIPIYRYRLDRTLFRRHDLSESLAKTARNLLARIPAPIQGRIKKMFRR
jgi:hypothetical protein